MVVRPDRLGDVILSTPVFSVIKKFYPQSELTVMVREGVAPLIRGIPGVDHVLIFEPERRHSGIKGFFRLFREVRAPGFRIVVVLQSHWKVAAAAFLANIRYRVGPLSALHSFFFYNRGVRQHRSQVEMHESDYNLQLLRRLGIRVGTRKFPTQVAVGEPARESAATWLEAQGWKRGSPLVVVHPGMGGSALNWPEAHYIELVRALLKDGRQVVVTGGPTETELLARIGKALEPADGAPENARAHFYLGGQSGTVEDLAGLYAHASVVVAPSTGPLHVAVALGRPVVTFYPPIRVQSVLRWGPYRPDEERASILVPEVFCGQDFKCLGHVCHYFPCMKSITVGQALEQVSLQLTQPPAQSPKEKP